MNWELQEWQQGTFQNDYTNKEKPENFEEMIKIAKVLCEGIPHVRVDLYNVDGKIYFGEMTFTSGSGFQLIYPESENKRLGDLWKIKKV